MPIAEVLKFYFIYLEIIMIMLKIINSAIVKRVISEENVDKVLFQIRTCMFHVSFAHYRHKNS